MLRRTLLVCKQATLLFLTDWAFLRSSAGAVGGWLDRERGSGEWASAVPDGANQVRLAGGGQRARLWAVAQRLREMSPIADRGRCSGRRGASIEDDSVQCSLAASHCTVQLSLCCECEGEGVLPTIDTANTCRPPTRRLHSATQPKQSPAACCCISPAVLVRVCNDAASRSSTSPPLSGRRNGPLFDAPVCLQTPTPAGPTVNCANLTLA